MAKRAYIHTTTLGNYFIAVKTFKLIQIANPLYFYPRYSIADALKTL